VQVRRERERRTCLSSGIVFLRCRPRPRSWRVLRSGESMRVHTSGVTDASVLIVEDDLELRGLLRRGLEEEGFLVSAVATGSDLLERIDRSVPDIYIIDIGLPDADGRDLCQALRARGVRAPVLFLTAREALVDRLAGFQAGGDDYVVKPFAFAEVVARLNALLRRAGEPGAIEFKGLLLDPLTHSIVGGEASVPLTPTEYRLLARLLARTGGEVVRRRALVLAAWPEGAIVSENTLDAYIARLRRKLRLFAGAPSIATVHGVGYRME
jgi:two-component system OmpR family response regulator